MEKVSVSTAIGHGSGGPKARVKSSSKGPMDAGLAHVLVRVPKGKQAHIPAPHDGDEKRQRSRRCRRRRGGCSEEFSFLLNGLTGHGDVSKGSMASCPAERFTWEPQSTFATPAESPAEICIPRQRPYR